MADKKVLVTIPDTHHAWVKKTAKQLGIYEREFFKTILDHTMKSGDLIERYKEQLKAQKAAEEKRTLEQQVKDAEEALKRQMKDLEDAKQKLTALQKA